MLAILMSSMRLRRKYRLKNEWKKKMMLCCRTCLSTQDLHPIFYGKGSERKRSEDLKHVTGLEIKLNDGLPQKICSKCVEAMNEALKFRRTSEKAKETLYSMGFRNTIRSTTKSTPNLQQSEEKISTQNLKFEDTACNNVNTDDFSYENNFDDDFQSNNDNENPTRIQRRKKEIGNPYKCNMCNKEFRMRNTYRAHMRFHTNYCVCELCGKKCRNNNLLLLHKRGRHGMERIHKCAYCEYSSANKEGLIIHERRHTGEKPYVCDHCGASFHRRSNLVQHVAIHLPDKNFQCPVCSKRVKSRKFLQIHVHNAHTGRRYAHLCPLCARRFEKPNKCEQCLKKFQSKKFLQSHKFKMHQGRRYTYVCHICSSHFTSTDSARKHLSRAHGVAREDQGPVKRIPNSDKNRYATDVKRISRSEISV